MAELLSSFGKQGNRYNLLSKKVDIEDTQFLSKYFVLQEFNPKLTAGKNSITFNGSAYLKKDSEVLIECLDSNNLPLYIGITSTANTIYKEASSYICSLHVYAETANGPAKLILYGTTTTGFKVRWVGNLLIDKTAKNLSSVRFFTKPTIEVTPFLFPIISQAADLTKKVILTGSFYSFAANPEKDKLKSSKKNVDIDYRVYDKLSKINTDISGSFNHQLEGSILDLMVNTIQEPYSYRTKSTNYTSSIKIKKVINKSTILLDDVVTYTDNKNNDVIVNIADGIYSITYPFITYNTASESSSYLKVNTDRGDVILKQCYADIVYRNLKTFSGYIARHKLYRKSLFAPGDFEVIADEPLFSYELLQDRLTTNKSFDKMGVFYNTLHVNKYLFTTSSYYSSSLELIQSSDRLSNGLHINCITHSAALTSSRNYIIIKDNTSDVNRDATYYPYDYTEFINTSGSSYDCNFVALKKNVDYLLSVNAIIKKDGSTIGETDAALEFYFTSSVPELGYEQNSIKNQPGLLKLGSIPSYESISEKIYDKPVQFLFSTANDLYGTLVISPYKCTAIISDLSIKPYGDYGYSPDILVTKIPFPIRIANESFEIKAELFDVNSNLVYSDLRTITSFDPSGSSLFVYIPGLKDPANTTFLSGSLEISKSLWVGKDAVISGSLRVKGNVQFDTIPACYDISSDSSRRVVAYHTDTGTLCYTNIVGIDPTVNNEYVNLTVVSGGNNVVYGIIPLSPTAGQNLTP